MNGFLKIFKNTAGFLDFKHSTILKSVYIENRKDFAGKFRYLSRGDEKICFVKDNYVFKIIFTSLAQFKTICEQFLFLNLFFGKSFNCNIIYIQYIQRNNVYLIVLKQKYVEHISVEIKDAINFFYGKAMKLYTQKKYCALRKDYILSFYLDFNVDRILQQLNFSSCLSLCRAYEEHLIYLASKYEKIILYDIKKDNMTFLDGTIFIYDISIDLEHK